MRFFRKVTGALLIVGNVISSTVLIIFYFTLFAIFAIPYRLFVRAQASPTSNFKPPRRMVFAAEDFKQEF